MNKIKLIANAKVNLSIDVLKKLPIGYHELDMIIQEIDISDTITLEKRHDGEIKIYSNWNLPKDSDNIAYKSARYIMDKYGLKRGYDIIIDKQIPIESGLAGGSADGAAVIKGLMLLENLEYIPVGEGRLQLDWERSDVDLSKCDEGDLYINSFDLLDICHGRDRESLLNAFSLEIAGKIGCDVSFFTRGKTMRVKGIGEILSPIENRLNYYFVIIKPKLNILTKWVYSNLKLENITQRPQNDDIEKALKTARFELLTDSMHNVLEDVVISEYPMIQEIKKKLLLSGSDISLMSGSGSSVFGMFQNYEDASKSFEMLRSNYDDIYLCKGF